ncbi:hypothetical protein [Mycoplasmoides pneumoniae]|uniref:hypothetical protein n=1 Tax=Mycoplasmoides pneumoniae TaxID=2104 RepID=UPI00071B4817|nr:hypothetical protein [Mycoplasmoides pneumoniae]
MKKSKEAVFEDKDYTEENPEQIFGNLYDGKLTVQDGKVKIAYDGSVCSCSPAKTSTVGASANTNELPLASNNTLMSYSVSP